MKIFKYLLISIVFFSNFLSADYIDKRTYVDEYGKKIKIITGNHNLPVLARYNPNGTLDLSFAMNGIIYIRTKSKMEDLKLIYKKDTGSIFIIDPNTADIIVYNNKGIEELSIPGKEESNLLSPEEAYELINQPQPIDDAHPRLFNSNIRSRNATDRYLNQVRLRNFLSAQSH